MKKKILVIDDDPAILEVIKIVLEEKGYEVATTLDGNKIEKKVIEINPKLILLDFLMIGPTGGDVTIKLKTNKKTKDIPIILISANHDIENLTRQFDVDGFLAKPFDIDQLGLLIEKHIA